MQIVRAALQFSRQQPAEGKQMTHRVTAIEMPSMCDIKNNWANRDKGQIGFETDFFRPYSAKEKQMSSPAEPIYAFSESTIKAAIFNWGITRVTWEPNRSILKSSLWAKNHNDESGETQPHQHDSCLDTDLQCYF